MKKKILLSLLVIVTLFTLVGCGKEPGMMTISISTKNGVSNKKLEDESIVDIKKNEVVKKNTITNKITGETTVQNIVEVRYDLTAKKVGKTTLSIEYEDYKTNEVKNKVYEIIVDNDLKITVN